MIFTEALKLLESVIQLKTIISNFSGFFCTKDVKNSVMNGTTIFAVLESIFIFFSFYWGPFGSPEGDQSQSSPDRNITCVFLLRPGKTIMQRHLQNCRTKLDPRAILYMKCSVHFYCKSFSLGQLLGQMEIISSNP